MFHHAQPKIMSVNEFKDLMTGFVIYSYNFIDNSIFKLEFKPHYTEGTTYKREEYALMVDFKKEIITLAELLQIKNSNIAAPNQFEQFLSSYRFYFMLFLAKKPMHERRLYCDRVMGGCSMADLYSQDPDLIDTFMQCDTDNDIFELARPLVEDYADCLARRMSVLPEELLQHVDWNYAEMMSPYEDFSQHKRAYPIQSGPNFQYQSFPAMIDGYWQENYVNKKVFDFAKTKVTNNNLTPQALAEIRALIISEEDLSERKRYPLPTEAVWHDRDKLIACLLRLQKMASTCFILKNILRERVPAHILDKLLHLRIHVIEDRGGSPERLPINYYTYKEYGVLLPDNKLLMWTQALSKYIEVYNVIPSTAFLQQFKAFLLLCHTSYQDAARELSQHLNAHPARVNYPGNHPVDLQSGLLRQEAFLQACREADVDISQQSRPGK